MNFSRKSQILYASIFFLWLLNMAPVTAWAQDSTKTEAPPAKLKTYEEVLKGEVETSIGLFNVHQVKDKYYFDIPENLFNKEMLMVTRFSKTPRGIKHGGEQISENVLIWERVDKKVFIRLMNYQNVITGDSTMHDALLKSNVPPIYADFNIVAENEDKDRVLIDVTGFAKGDETAFGTNTPIKNMYQIGAIELAKTYINEIVSHANNIHITSTKTYKTPNHLMSLTNGGRYTFEISNSIVLLPENPMTPRLEDRRIGYFAQQQVDFGLNQQGVANTSYIRRWRLEPKDPEAYFAGQLSEPIKPIVFYIDPATPAKWIPYLKQGVEDWNEAFEAAGFKNAIMAKDAPTPEEDPTWSVTDTRYSIIRYLASQTENAYGPHVADPRTGEILSSHIGWFHNVMSLIRHWYFVQTAATNPEARPRTLDDEVMGKLIRYIAAHEVGHAIGLPHNFLASRAYSVDSLRSRTFTDLHGSTPSIMDYARFNYIAQPEDGVKNFMPQIGPYDIYSINWGYRYYPNIKSPQDETPILNQLIEEKADDPIYRYSKQLGLFERQNDSRAQTEDLGDDPVRASTYGIYNLQRIMDNLHAWTYEKGDNYDALTERYNRLFGQWNLYIGHVQRSIGGIHQDHKSMDQEGAIYSMVPAEEKVAAVQFLNEFVFKTPNWLIEPTILDKIGDEGQLVKLTRAQNSILSRLMHVNNFNRLEEWRVRDGNTFTVPTLLSMLNEGLFDPQVEPDYFRRLLQRSYIQFLQAHRISNLENASYDAARNSLGMRAFPTNVDYTIYVEQALKDLNKKIKSARRSADKEGKVHYEDLLKRIL